MRTKKTPRVASVATTLWRCGGRDCGAGECEKDENTLHRDASGSGPAYAPGIVHEVLRTNGAALPQGVRIRMEHHLGHDFSDVRIHADTSAARSAQAVNALAYTVGRHVVFGDGRYDPLSKSGLRLLRHELSHAADAGTGAIVGPGRLRVSSNRDPAEQRAHRNEDSCGREVEAVTVPSVSSPRLACALAGEQGEVVSPDQILDKEPPTRQVRPGQPLAGGSATIVCNGSDGYRVALNGWAGATCGIVDCVRRHEESHATDWRGRWPEGCKGKADGDTIPLGGPGYPAFLKTSECTAYGVEESCISPKLAAATKGGTACAATLRAHLADTRVQKTRFC